MMPLKMLFSSEIFPWALLYSFRRSLSVSFAYVIFVGYLVLSAMLMLGNFASVLVPARALFALVNATVIFFVLMSFASCRWPLNGSSLPILYSDWFSFSAYSRVFWNLSCGFSSTGSRSKPMDLDVALPDFLPNLPI
ncbi:MAG: hypothetical protein J0653_00995 [Deltaproteobacteria bacterium]|nr:hypothetical protein [Deltaproteobacteria bacterium]